jgi:hypothetical protein
MIEPYEIYSASGIKRHKRRTKAEMEDLLAAVWVVLDENGNDRVMVRHLCYRLSSKGVIPKRESDFDALGKHLANWRKGGRIPFGRFVDSTRWYHGSTTFNNAAEALKDSVTNYRKNLWRDQPFHVEVWVEKEAVASIVVPVADSWGIKTFVCRGFASLTSTWEAAEIFKQAISHGKTPVILYLGDYDKAGQEIDAAICNHLDMHGVGVGKQVFFLRVAILHEQIKEFALPTRPPKRKGDPEHCVEIDTLSSAQIRDLLEAKITALIESSSWEQLLAIEAAERETLGNILILHRDELEGAA